MDLQFSPNNSSNCPKRIPKAILHTKQTTKPQTTLNRISTNSLTAIFTQKWAPHVVIYYFTHRKPFWNW